MSEVMSRRDISFLLYEFLNTESLLGSGIYASHDKESVEAILDVAASMAEAEFAPIAAKMDAQEPAFRDGRVEMIPEAAKALKASADAGFFAMGFPEELGGLQTPYIISAVAGGMFTAANTSLAAYPFLTTANANLLTVYGTEDQKARYLPPMLDGRAFGTMCLSEPQAGSSLSDIRTMARPRGDGTYTIRGSKMWISGGDHEMSENIHHLVLAKTPGAPPGVKGISLFMVPRYRVGPDGEKGEWNNIALAGLNHKMGQRGTVNCLLNFGEDGECIGELVGEEGKGLACMFHMMNEARILVGHAAAVLGVTGFLHSLAYAKERPQGRHPHNKDPETPQIPIIEHADVRRMLLKQKAIAEGSLALVMYAAFLIDLQRTSSSEAEKRDCAILLDVLTPIVKAWPSDHCLEANSLAIQVLGGYGYTRDYPLERFYRDNRINPIHEGANGIQGIDLLGRKVRMHNGAGFRLLVQHMNATAEEARRSAFLKEKSVKLERAVKDLIRATDTISAHDDLNTGLANASLYLDAAGHVVIAWMWLRQALIASKAITEGTAEKDFYKGKLLACRYFFRYELPKALTDLNMVI